MSAVNGINGHRPIDGLQWKVGLINSAQKYLTAEPFGFKVNASGTALKKKQAWMIEQDPHEDGIYLKSHLGRYLATDKMGNVTCDSEERGPTERFVVEYNAAGQWAFRNFTHGYYLGGTEDMVHCSSKSPSAPEWWVFQLAIHPHVHLRNVNRKRYAHLRDAEIQFTELIPWGSESLFLLEFHDGKYIIKSSDSRYLNKEGELSEELTQDCLFTLELRSGQQSGLAFKDSTGRYLTAVGPSATMKARNKTISKDELFTIEDSHPQVIFTAHNGRKVSVKQGVDVSANQEEESMNETFQIEFDKTTEKWAIRTVNNSYWSLEAASGIQAKVKDISKNCLFDFEWQGDGTVAIKASNNNYIFNKPTGSLSATSESIGEKEKFCVRMVNHPTLVLKGEFGFIGLKSTSGQKSEIVCNKATFDTVNLEANESGGCYKFRANNGKYWTLDSDGSVILDGARSSPFVLEFRGQSVFTIKPPNGQFVKGEQNGLFKTVGKEVNPTTLWEF